MRKSVVSVSTLSLNNGDFSSLEDHSWSVIGTTILPDGYELDLFCSNCETYGSTLVSLDEWLGEWLTEIQAK